MDIVGRHSRSIREGSRRITTKAKYFVIGVLTVPKIIAKPLGPPEAADWKRWVELVEGDQ